MVPVTFLFDSENLTRFPLMTGSWRRQFVVPGHQEPQLVMALSRSFEFRSGFGEGQIRTSLQARPVDEGFSFFLLPLYYHRALKQPPFLGLELWRS